MPAALPRHPPPLSPSVRSLSTPALSGSTASRLALACVAVLTPQLLPPRVRLPKAIMHYSTYFILMQDSPCETIAMS
jgi:hypothetical protein